MFVGTLILRQGKPFKVSFALSGTDVADLTGYNFRMMVRTGFSAPSPLLSINSAGASPNATMDVANKVATADVAASVTAAITGPTMVTKWVSDAELYHSNGDVIDLGSYQVEWQPEVTK